MTGPMPAIVRGDARNLPMPDASVDLIVTSPPFFGLRSYQDGGQHYDGQLGAEANPGDYVDALIACTREMVRVLKPEGSIFINLGDKYAGVADGRNNNGYGGGTIAATHSNPAISDRKSAAGGTFKVSFGSTRTKSLVGIPWRYALRAIDDLGLILRAELIWSKPNGLPESVTDRVRRSHETWFHFTTRPKYYSAVDEIREPTNIGNRPVATWAERKASGNVTHAPDNGHSTGVGMAPNPLGKLPGSVWTIATQPLKVPDELGIDHFAAFPMEWPRRLILGWSPRDVCSACGEGRRPLSDRGTVDAGGALARATLGHITATGQRDGREGARRATVSVITGYVCGCPDSTATTTPGVVLDPFGGTGTTALVAAMNGRVGISVDASADYCRLAEWRAADAKQRARAASA